MLSHLSNCSILFVWLVGFNNKVTFKSRFHNLIKLRIVKKSSIEILIK